MSVLEFLFFVGIVVLLCIVDLGFEVLLMCCFDCGLFVGVWVFFGGKVE